MRGTWLLLALFVALSPRAASGPTGTAVVIGRNVRLRAHPRLDAQILTVLDQGRQVEVVGRSDGWYQVRADLAGWVAEPYLRLDLEGRIPAGGKARELIDLAQAMLGRSYVYGAEGPSCFDCSGLIYYLHQRIGVPLPREAGPQMRTGLAVSRDELRPADLVFFTTNGRGTVSHVGIYLFDGEFIHASSGRGCVTTSTMNMGYYQRNFVAAARVLPEEKM